MKILFITTYNVNIEKEHYFTKNVYSELNNTTKDLSLLSIIESKPNTNHKTLKKEHNSFELQIPSFYRNKKDNIINALVSFFTELQPDIIHSNMIEGYELEAAYRLRIPVVLSVHIGGLICPRGGGNGFLMNNDKICTENVGSHCAKCCSKDLPLPKLSYCLIKYIPGFLQKLFLSFTKNRNIFYFTPTFSKKKIISERKKVISLFCNCTVIAPNKWISQKLTSLGTIRTVIIPHGITPRNRLPFPEISYSKPVKFFYIGRIQYAKGLHNLFTALNKLDHSLYELHIIGDSENARRERMYDQQLKDIANKLDINATFHGRIPNENLENTIKNYHVMIHPAICMEVYGIAIAESLSMGHPVLATQCGGPEMQIINNINGWLVPPNDITSLREKILHIISIKETISSISQNCKTPHPINDYVEKLKSLYAKISHTN